MGQLLNMAFGGMPFAQMQVMNAPWVPLADVSETDDAYTVEVECRGAQGQINVELSDRELVIGGGDPGNRRGGERPAPAAVAPYRALRVPHRAARRGEPGRVSANLSDGVLSVKIPKAEEAKSRRIEVTG